MKTASLFMNGRSQAVRLPAEFRFEGKQVYVSRDPRTGNVILSAQPPASPWKDFMALRDAPGGSEGVDTWLADRDQGSQTRDPFAGWVE
ncbi:antitoxin [Sphaerotilus sp.]|uniref:antitoxin n=1 Tax=Sphaerotilus sp. TaxID=2093942 RepID=UPI002ACDE1B9|nr:AbrB/MazE/SpoVT family DNA-binding domain-containing protein [Sphaerotilus sp.]MDZ7856834.1 AbrB/MazE/SpoVT family DNA-binding domain-containing protein [Sphaerotilus sp.]